MDCKVPEAAQASRCSTTWGAYTVKEGYGTASATSGRGECVSHLKVWLRKYLLGHTWTSICIYRNNPVPPHADVGRCRESEPFDLFRRLCARLLWVDCSGRDEVRTSVTRPGSCAKRWLRPASDSLPLMLGPDARLMTGKAIGGLSRPTGAIVWVR